MNIRHGWPPVWVAFFLSGVYRALLTALTGTFSLLTKPSARCMLSRLKKAQDGDELKTVSTTRQNSNTVRV
jgi:hypothetical protein